MILTTESHLLQTEQTECCFKGTVRTIVQTGLQGLLWAWENYSNSWGDMNGVFVLKLNRGCLSHDLDQDGRLRLFSAPGLK